MSTVARGISIGISSVLSLLPARRELVRVSPERSTPEPTEEPHLKFPCGACDVELSLQDLLGPGDAAVLACDNCGESWTIVQPSLEVHKTKEYEPIWEYTAQ